MGSLPGNNEVGGQDLFTQEPVVHCPKCGQRACAEFVDNGFGPYSVQSSPWHCENCGWIECNHAAMTGERCPECGTLWQLHDGPTLLCRRIASLEESAAFGLQCYQDRCENAYVEASVVKRLEQQLAILRESMQSIATGAVDPVFCAKSALERLKDNNGSN